MTREEYIYKYTQLYSARAGIEEGTTAYKNLREEVEQKFDAIQRGDYKESEELDKKYPPKKISTKRILLLSCMTLIVSIFLAPLIYKAMFGVCVVIWITFFSISCLTGNGCD